MGSSQRVEQVARGRVGKCLGACVSVRQGDAASNEGTYGACSGDGKGSEPTLAGPTRVCGDRISFGNGLGVAAGQALEELVGFGVEEEKMFMEKR